MTRRTRSTPGAVVLVRVVVGVQVLLGLAGLFFLGLVAALALGWRVDGRTDMTGAVLGLIAVSVVLIAFVGALVVAVSRLGRDPRARSALIGLEALLLAGLLVLPRAVGGRLGFSGAPGPVFVLGLTAVITLIALLGRRRPRP